MTTFDLEEREHSEPRVRLVEISGDLDLTNARDLQAHLDDLTRDDDVVLVLDLNRVLFIDSAALHVLFRTARSLGTRRFGLVLEPSAAIARTLEIVGLSQFVPVRSSADDIVAALAAIPR